MAVFAQKTFGKQQRWLGNVLMDVKISKIPEFPICGQPREIVRNFRNSIPEINVFHLIFKQDFWNFRQMKSAPRLSSLVFWCHGQKNPGYEGDTHIARNRI